MSRRNQVDRFCYCLSLLDWRSDLWFCFRIRRLLVYLSVCLCVFFFLQLCCVFFFIFVYLYFIICCNCSFSVISIEELSCEDFLFSAGRFLPSVLWGICGFWIGTFTVNMSCCFVDGKRYRLLILLSVVTGSFCFLSDLGYWILISC